MLLLCFGSRKHPPPHTCPVLDSLTNEIEAKFPILFNNIDGAASNFDSFTTELGLCRTEFSIIGIAETNLDEEHGKLYNLPGYKPEFQSKFYGKTKGSGHAIFLKDNLIYSLCNTQSQCTKNLESLYIKVTNLPKPVYFGVVYRPPSAQVLKVSVNLLLSLRQLSKAYRLRMFTYLETITLTSLVVVRN